MSIPLTPYNPKIIDTDGTTTLYDGFTVIHVMELWYDWYVEMRQWQNDEPYQIFYGLWTHYCNTHLPDFLRMYHTAYGDYDPLSNYDMTEQSFEGRILDKTKDTTTPSGTTTNTTTTTGKLTDTLNMYKTGLGSGGIPTLVDKSESVSTSGDVGDTNQRAVTSVLSHNQAKTEVQNTPDNTKSFTYDGDTLTGYHEIYDRRHKRKGNIGVMAGQDLVMKEEEVRNKYNWLVLFVKQFFQLYGYYTGGVS